tara:strand:- start:5211 stop:5531 length:321 start_codon:yes stop_codon:yes gene_type:complete
MTNESAINIVNEHHESGKIDAVARVFLCEDILENGVDEWLCDLPDNNLSEIIELAEEKSRDFIQSLGSDESIDEASKLEHTRKRMIVLVKLVSDYMLVRELIHKQS